MMGRPGRPEPKRLEHPRMKHPRYRATEPLWSCDTLDANNLSFWELSSSICPNHPKCGSQGWPQQALVPGSSGPVLVIWYNHNR